MPTLFLTKASKMYNGEKTAFSTRKWLPAYRKLKLGLSCHPVLVPTQSGLRTSLPDLKPCSYYKRAGNTLETIRIGKDFLSRTPAAQQLRENMNKWDYMKLNCC
jgi:hypothetical protein